MHQELTLLSNTLFYKYVLQYIYRHYTNKIKAFEYLGMIIYQEILVNLNIYLNLL